MARCELQRVIIGELADRYSGACQCGVAPHDPETARDEQLEDAIRRHRRVIIHRASLPVRLDR
jgi:hypothetical protein